MKKNKFRILSIAFCCLFSSLFSEIKCMDSIEETIRNLSKQLLEIIQEGEKDPANLLEFWGDNMNSSGLDFDLISNTDKIMNKLSEEYCSDQIGKDFCFQKMVNILVDIYPYNAYVSPYPNIPTDEKGGNEEVSSGGSYFSMSTLQKSLEEAALQESLVKPKKYKERLFLGEADFSYSVALIRKHLEAHPDLPKFLTITELDTKENLEITYFETFYNHYQFLESRVGSIQFGINACIIDTIYAEKRFHRIHFNFPHDKSNYQDRTLPLIIAGFFKSASHLQLPRDRIHVALPKAPKEDTNKFYQGYVYDIYTASRDAGYKLIKKRKFDSTRYPGYSHRETGTAKSATVANKGREYIFEKVSMAEELGSFQPRKHFVYGQYVNALPAMDTDSESSDYEDTY